MTTQDIYNTLERYYNSATQTLTLPDDQLGPEIQQLFDAYLVGQQLVITNANIQNSGNEVLVYGTGNNLPFTGMSIEAHFTATEDGQAQLQSIITAPTTNWTLASSFPVLLGTLFSTLAYTGPQTFSFNSYDYSATAPQGLTFNGAITLAGNWALLSWLLSGQSSVAVTGPIGLIGQAPQMELMAPLGAPIDLGYFTVPIAFKLCSTAISPAPGYGSAFAYTEAELSADITFTSDGQAVILPVTASYFDLPSLLNLSVRLDNAVGATLTDLSALLNDTPLSSVLPSGWTIPNIVNLTELDMLVNPATQSLSSASIGVATAQPWTVVPDLLTIEQIELTFTLVDPLNVQSNQSLQLAMLGKVAMGGGLIEVRGYYPDFYFSGRLIEGTRIDLKLLAEKFFGPLPNAPSLTVTQLSFAMQPGTGLYNGSVTVESDWTLSLGSIALTVKAAYFAINHTADATTGAIGGILTFGSGDDTYMLEVLWNLPGDIQLTGTLPSISLTKLIQLLSSQPLTYTLPDIELTNSVIFVEENATTGNFYFALGTQVNSNGVDWGDFEIEFLSTNSGTGFAFGFVLPQTWSLADLSSAFSSLSWLKFVNLSLIVATVDDPNFQFRSISTQAVAFPTQLPSAPAGVRAGMRFHAELLLQGGALNTISRLLGGTTSLGLDAFIPADNYANTTLTATLNGALNLIGQYVVLNNVYLTIQPERAYINFHMAATFNIWNSSLTLSGDIALRGEEVNFELRTQTPWVNPFGIHGLTINNMGIEFTLGAVVAFSLGAEITIGSGSSQIVVDAGMEFNVDEEGVPDVMLVREVGTVKLSDIITTFTPAHVPSELTDIELRGFLLIIVANPLGWTDPADNKFYSFGVAFSTTLYFYGQTAAFAIQVVVGSSLSASGSMDQPLRIGNIVTLTSATNPHQGPYFQINTTGPHYLTFSAKLSMFEISSLSVNAIIQSGAFYFTFNYQISGLGQISVASYLQNHDEFDFTATAHFAVGNVGPIRTARGKYLGKLRINLNLNASFNIHIGPGGAFLLTLAAGFSFQGYNLTLSYGPVSANIHHLSDLLSQYADALAAQLWSIASRVLQDAAALFAAVAQGVLNLTDDIANILYNELRTSLTQAVQLMKGVAHVMSWDVVHIASLVKTAYNAGINTLARALKDAAYGVESVAHAIGSVFNKGASDVANVLKAVGYDLDSIARALKNVFGWSATDVANFFKNTWRIADTVVHDALSAAGYAASEIEDAMEEVFNWVSDTVDTVVYYVNPKNW